MTLFSIFILTKKIHFTLLYIFKLCKKKYSYGKKVVAWKVWEVIEDRSDSNCVSGCVEREWHGSVLELNRLENGKRREAMDI